MKLCTFIQVAELRHALPVSESVTLVYTPASKNVEPFSFLTYKGGDGVLVEPCPNSVQPKQWTLQRTDLGRALAAFVGSVTPVMVGDQEGTLVLSAGAQAFTVGASSPIPSSALVTKRIHAPVGATLRI